MNKGIVIFDLDGTLADTSEGIFRSVRYTEKEMCLPPVPEEMLRLFVGPPPKDMYKQLYRMDESLALQATEHHRHYGKTRAIYEAKLYKDMKVVLQTLKNKGYLLAVATLKKEDIACSMLHNLGIEDYFDTIVGMDKAETYTKCLTIKEVWRRLGKMQNTVMIGDTDYDYQGAREAECQFIAVIYGFGFSAGDKLPQDVIVAEFPNEIVDKVEKLI